MKKDGFTLIELMVAVACACALSFAAWNCFDAYHRMAVFFAVDYDRMSVELLLRLRNMVPYGTAVKSTKKARDFRGPSSNRF